LSFSRRNRNRGLSDYTSENLITFDRIVREERENYRRESVGGDKKEEKRKTMNNKGEEKKEYSTNKKRITER
jgi:hypothetical protein